ncbi:MAG TPA: type II secretion system protein GspC [Steroidobacteraceae bacterium]|nr:type II secretion system protein GspC [Steroidobacteraceae bacterium]
MSSLSNLQSSINQLHTLNREQLGSLLMKLAQPAVIVVSVVGIAWQLAQLTWLLFRPSVDVTPVPVAAPIQTSTTKQTFNPQSIADAHLFGMASATPDANINNLPQTQANLVLAGTIALSDPEAGYAIIGENAANAKFYKAGAMINGGVRLHSVYPDRVILDRAGSLETLALPHGPSTGMPNINQPTINPGAQFSDNIRRIATTNPGALSQMLRVQPVFSNGTQKGFRVYPGRDRAQFARLGLQPGDLITSINGMMLNVPGATNDILGLLSSSSSVVVGLERNGTPMQLNLDVTQINLPPENAPATGEQPEMMERVPPGVPSAQ